MRDTKEIVINDNGTAYTYTLTKLSALGLQKWGARAICALAESGILDMKDKDLTGGFAEMFNIIMSKGFGFLGKLNCDRVDSLLLELIEKTAERKVGAASIKVNEQDLEATLTDIKSLFELEKECFVINFPQFVVENQSSSLQSQVTENATTKRGISVTPSAR